MSIMVGSLFMERNSKLLIVAIFIIAVFVCMAVFLERGDSAPKQTVEQESKVVNTEQVYDVIAPSGAMSIKAQSFGNLPFGLMKGSFTREEIRNITGVEFPSDSFQTKGEYVDTLNMSAMAQFEKVAFVVDQSYDQSDRKVYWSKDVDIQRWNTFGIDSRDHYLLEKLGDFYVFRDFRGNICFFAYGLSEAKEERRVQSLVNVPWRNLSGNLTLSEVAERFTFPHLGTGSYSYNPEDDAGQQIASFNLSEGERRGWQTTDRGKFEQMVFIRNGTVYEAQGVEISPGDYPGGITPTGATPPFLMLTVRAGQPEERVFVLFFYDKNKNLVAAGWTKKLPSMSSGGGNSGSSPSGGSSGGPGGRPSI